MNMNEEEMNDFIHNHYDKERINFRAFAIWAIIILITGVYLSKYQIFYLEIVWGFSAIIPFIYFIIIAIKLNNDKIIMIEIIKLDKYSNRKLLRDDTIKKVPKEIIEELDRNRY